MTTCLPLGYVVSPWGTGSWGGTQDFVGGPLPFNTEFNIYCAGPCGEMVAFLDYDSVEHSSGGDQITVDTGLTDLVMTSGGTLPTDTARVFVDVNVGPAWSLECTFRIDEMPSDFTNLPERHLFIGNADRQTACAGLFFSSIGIAYVGSTFYDTNGNLVPNSPMQVLPDSIGLVLPNTYYTVRLIVDANTGTVFIYITPTASVPVIGHQLKYILPTITSDSQIVRPEDGTTISLRGTVASPTKLQVNLLCLGNGLAIANRPPIADAGTDQAARICSIVRLDGRRSFDPEGANILYKWRLIDGPLTSAFVIVGDDGHTIGSLQTNKFYSSEAESFVETPGIVGGDVVLVDNVPHTIIGTGVDGDGFYIQVDGHVLEGNLAPRPFRILKQRSISGANKAQPTFFPDVSGLYKFDLVVFDGGLFSSASNTIVNVTESPVPRGCPIDVRFLWNYISDFWRLVENTEVIETFWGALAQLAASELLTLWQHEYGKSLRDIQRTFQRRWLHYDLFIQEPQIELTTVRSILAGVQSIDIDPTVGVDVTGQTIALQMPNGTVHEIFLTQPSSASPQATTSNVLAFLLLRLQQIDARFTVDTITKSDGKLRFVVRAPFFFVFTAASTATSLFTFPNQNDLPRGSGGAAVGVNSYRVGSSLAGVDVQAGDSLVVDGVAYGISRVVTDTNDPWPSQRLILSSSMPLNVSSNWIIATPTKSQFLDFYSSLCSAGDTAIYEVVEEATGAIAYIACDTISASPAGTTALLTEHGPIAPYLFDEAFTVYFHSIYRSTYMPVEPLVSEVPTLQERIRDADDQEVLRQNIDYFHAEFRGLPCLQFVTGDPDVWQGELPPRRMWAETTYIDNRPAIEQNFGIPAGFDLDDLSKISNNVDYLSCVRGLWYSYFNGPTLYNLRAGTQILLGLPFAEEAGIILEIDEDFSPNQGRFLVQDQNEQAIVRSYTYPRGLSIEPNPDTNAKYKVGDNVKQFSPLVEGVEIIDYVKDPKWFEGFLAQGSLYEVEKFFKFLVRIDSNAFNLNTLLFASQFVRRIKPTYTFPLFIVRSVLDQTTVDTSDFIQYRGKLLLYTGAWTTSGKGQAQMFDHPHPSGGGWWNQWDGGPSGPYVRPTYPTALEMSNWLGDQAMLTPNETLLATLTRIISSPEMPGAGSIYYTGVPIWTNVVAVLADGMRFWIPQSGYEIGRTTIATAVTLTKMAFFVRVIAANNTPLIIRLKKNGTTIDSHSFNTSATGTGLEATMTKMQFDISIPLIVGDVLSAELAHSSLNFNTFIELSTVIVGEGQSWTTGVAVGPGTFKTLLPL